MSVTCVRKNENYHEFLTISYDSKTELLVIVPLVNTVTTICVFVSPSSDTTNTAYSPTEDHKKAESDLV